MTAGILATLAVLAAVRVTLLKNWNIRRVAWTLDDNALKLDDQTILVADIQSSFLRQHSMTRGVWTLTIWTKTPQRLAGVAIGPQRQASMLQPAAAVRRPGPGPGRGAPGVREGVHHA